MSNDVASTLEDLGWNIDDCEDGYGLSEVIRKEVKKLQSERNAYKEFVETIKERHEFNETNTKECKDTKYEERAIHDNYSRIRNNIVYSLRKLDKLITVKKK